MKSQKKTIRPKNHGFPVTPSVLASAIASFQWGSIAHAKPDEWRDYPKQLWEFDVPTVHHSEPVLVTRTRHRGVLPERYTPQIYVADERLAIFGEIIASPSVEETFFIGQSFFIRAHQQLQVGQVYSIADEETPLQSSRDGRIGYRYPIYGKAKIIGVRDGMFIATLIEATGSVKRGLNLVSELGPISRLRPKAAPTATPAQIIAGATAAERQLVFLDVGKTDGIQPGMVFRQYLHHDPFTGQEVSSRDFMIQAELQVLEAQERFSMAVVLQARGALLTGEPVIALTDLSDFGRTGSYQTVLGERANVRELIDDVEADDRSVGPGATEARELRQLEIFDESVEAGSVTGRERSGIEFGNEPAPQEIVEGRPFIPDTEPNASPVTPRSSPENASPNTDQIPRVPLDQPLESPMDIPGEPEPTPAPTLAPPPNPAEVETQETSNSPPPVTELPPPPLEVPPAEPNDLSSPPSEPPENPPDTPANNPAGNAGSGKKT